MNNKKAQGISMNFIIVAALALLVLVVISLIFISRTNTFNEQTKNCEQSGGQCIDMTRYPTCQIAAKSMAEYDAGRTRSDLRCYDSRGQVKNNYICCQLV